MNFGLDVGTKNIVMSYRDQNGKIKRRHEINGFCKLNNGDGLSKQLLTQNNVPFVEYKDDIIALGARAEELSYAFNQPLQRPMADGVVNGDEDEAINIMSTIIRSLLLGVIAGDSVIYYCVPAKALNAELNVAFHQKVIQMIVDSVASKGMKLNAVAMNEARAMVFSQIPDKTAIAVSCLTGDNVIYTNRGLIKIEEVKVGDKVLSKNGKFNRVYAVTPSKRNEEIISLHFSGSSYGLKLTCEHKVWADKGEGWDWYRADELDEGDVLGEPIPLINQKRNFISISTREGNSLNTYNEVFQCSKAVGRFIGYFLADGHIDCHKGDADARIVIDFNKDEQAYVDDVIQIVDSVFHRVVKDQSGSRSNSRIEFYSRSLAKWFRTRCYDANGNKTMPFELHTMSRPFREGLISGLFRGDGWTSDGLAGYETVNRAIIQDVHMLLSTLGIKSSVTHRDQRNDGVIDGRQIKSNENGSYQVTVTGSDLERLKVLIDDEKSKSELIWQQGGWWCTKIKKIERIQFNGDVWDLSVENDPSFCVPYACVHNCGAGMVNACYCLYGLPIFEFSLVGSGDWIDRETTRVIKGETTTSVCRYKENKLKNKKFSLKKMPDDNVGKALYINYGILIENVVKGLVDGFVKNEDKARLERPMPIVFGGGTAMVDGFQERFSEVLNDMEVPFEVGKIQPADPMLYAVADGCLIASEL